MVLHGHPSFLDDFLSIVPSHLILIDRLFTLLCSISCAARIVGHPLSRVLQVWEDKILVPKQGNRPHILPWCLVGGEVLMASSELWCLGSIVAKCKKRVSAMRRLYLSPYPPKGLDIVLHVIGFQRCSPR